ncbi:CFI-box-CTERM domain-containing protein [Catenibacterium mitsuokai]|uniref:CFI-box-CTERM domain-containing protein n=1 Tax=Catenibacterium mitsuokai TaxID=100886 RepID=UPI003F8BDE03
MYGSYDCPSVWTLRRFRDDCLFKTIGRWLFIRFYYCISPSIVSGLEIQRFSSTFGRLYLIG